MQWQDTVRRLFMYLVIILIFRCGHFKGSAALIHTFPCIVRHLVTCGKNSIFTSALQHTSFT